MVASRLASGSQALAWSMLTVGDRKSSRVCPSHQVLTRQSQGVVTCDLTGDTAQLMSGSVETILLLLLWEEGRLVRNMLLEGAGWFSSIAPDGSLTGR